jgi:glutamyl-tRNA reductase
MAEAPPHPPRFPGRDPEVSAYAESDTELILGGRKLVVVGYTHRTAPLAGRSRFAIPKEEHPHLARRFKALPGVGGCVVLATCNRLEVYLEIRSEAEAEAAFVDLLGGQDLEGRALLARSLMVHSSIGAVKHLFRVTSGLDSMVLGDAQILNQVKGAYRSACHHGTAGPQIHKAFHMAFRCAKKVRTETNLGGEARSVAGSAVSLLAKEIGGLRAKEFLLVGVNEMTEAAGKRLTKAGAARLVLCNRTRDRGQDLAAEIQAETVDWDELWNEMARVDAVVTCTGATAPIFTRSQIAEAAAARPDRPLTLVDMAVPPDVEPLTADSSVLFGAESAGDSKTGVRIIDLEDIGAFQTEVEKRRCEAAPEGESIVVQQVVAFTAWLRDQTIGPKMERFREEAEQILARELERAAHGVSREQQEQISVFGRTLVKRFLGALRRLEDQD